MASPTELITIEKLVYGGAGLARTPERVTLVPFTAAGEQVRIAPGKVHGGHREARLESVEIPSPDRVAPPCPHFSACGGCHYQHLSYAAQATAKVSILREQLRRIGRLDVPETIRALTGEPLGYRNRIQLHIDRARIGYREAGSHKIVPVKECAIAAPALNQAISALRERVHHRHFPKFIREIELFTNGTETMLNVVRSEAGIQKHFFEWMAEAIPGADKSAIDYAAGDDRFQVSHQSFFQVNRFLIEPLVTLALEGAAGHRGLDLYAGVGLFTIPLARIMPRLKAVEVVRAAAHDLAANAARANAGVEVIQKPAEAYLSELKSAPDFVLADPPRAGLGKQATADLIRLKPPRITLVSCDPATLARDLAPLTAAGYRMADLAMVDLFPQTYHVEAVVRLEA